MQDGVEVAVYRWDAAAQPRAVVQVAHGMGEYGQRYGRLAEALTAAGYTVYASDHRGHGETATGPDDLGHFRDEAGWEALVDDLFRINQTIAERHPGLPRVLLGHSMGAIVVQDYLALHGDSLAGAVLSAAGGGRRLLAGAASLIARFERMRLGPRVSSDLLQALSFGDFNKRFEPTRTEFDWLSADEAEVDAYIADPQCGVPITVQGWIDVLHGVRRIDDPAQLGKIPETMPLYVMSGSLDPVGNATKGVTWLLERLKRAGAQRVTHRFYEGGRHEMFNEVNRTEVVADLVEWLDALFSSSAGAAA